MVWLNLGFVVVGGFCFSFFVSRFCFCCCFVVNCDEEEFVVVGNL